MFGTRERGEVLMDAGRGVQATAASSVGVGRNITRGLAGVCQRLRRGLRGRRSVSLSLLGELVERGATSVITRRCYRNLFKCLRISCFRAISPGPSRSVVHHLRGMCNCLRPFGSSLTGRVHYTVTLGFG